MNQTSEHYTFGDTDLAAQRLALLGRVFEPGSAQLFTSLGTIVGTVGVDLGCGVGHTTRLLAERTQVERIVGLDQSKKLLETAARRYANDRVWFTDCDVTRPPFPVAAASILYSRFLLTHLREPARVIEAWALAAQPGAHLVLEETASMHGENTAFSRYYALVERMQAHYGQRMYIGRELASIAREATHAWTVEHAQIAPRALAATDMARLHVMNLRTWSQDPFARAQYDDGELRELASDLDEIALGEVRAEPVTVAMGQVVLRRR